MVAPSRASGGRESEMNIDGFGYLVMAICNFTDEPIGFYSATPKGREQAMRHAAEECANPTSHDSVFIRASVVHVKGTKEFVEVETVEASGSER